MVIPNFINQDRTFAFVIITRHAIQNFCFEWEERNHPLHMKILNTICGWQFVRDWKDKDYDFPIGRAVVMSDIIHQSIEELKKDFMQSLENEHKKLISNLYNTIFSVANEEIFFVYRLVYSLPAQTILFRIQTELQFVNSHRTKEEADQWYEMYSSSFFDEYQVFQYIEKKQGELDRTKRTCRFCNRKVPNVTFDKIAHAISESIGGHKNLICYEECDDCNTRLAKVEDYLCNWLEFRRCQFGVKRKRGGVPKAYGRNYIIENEQITVIDKESRETDDNTLAIGANLITLQGIYRALCKISIDLIESEYLLRLQNTIDWINGKLKGSKYPQIAQMIGLPQIDKPNLFIFTRKDGIDSDNTPLHFCILRIFDLAFLYVLPHVDGRILFASSYTTNINTNALEVLGLNKEWRWESYDTTELRNPHVKLNISKSIQMPSPLNKKDCSSKLRPEKKPLDSIDFNNPTISDKDIVTHNIRDFYCNPHLEAKGIIQTVGLVSTECIFDVLAHCPLFLRLRIKFDNVIKNKTFANLTYEIYFSPNVYKGQFECSQSSVSVNQILIINALEITLNYLFQDIINQHPRFYFTREQLSINNVSELLSDMKIIFVKGGVPLRSTKGEELWHSGYQ